MFRHSTLVLPALSVVLAAAWALTSSVSPGASSIPLAGALVAAGVLLGGRTGTTAGFLGLGLLLVWGRPGLLGETPPGVDTSRPLVLVGRSTGDWQRDEFGWRVDVRVSHFRQGREVPNWPRRLEVSLGGDERPPPGDIVRARGFLRRSPGFANIAPSSPGPWSLRVKSRRFLEIQASPRPVAAGLRLLRRRLEAGLSRLENRQCRPVLAALVLGRNRDLVRETRQQIRRLGLSHLFAVSGLHISLLAAMAYAGLSILPRRFRLLMVASAVSFYVLLSGARAATLRAALMAAIVLIAMIVARPTRSLQSLCAGVILLVGGSPTILLDLGFQLTASATAGIVCLAPIFDLRWKKLPRLLRRSLGATLGAQLGSGPIAWSVFGLFHPAAPLLNLLAMPWIIAMLSASLSWACLTLVHPLLGATLVPVCDWLASPLQLLDRLPTTPVLTWPVRLDIARSTAAAACLFFVLAVAGKRALRLACAGLFLVIIAGPRAGRGGELVLLDVGQGDSILLRDGNRTALIDGGGWRQGDIGSRLLMPTLAALGVRSLETIVVTHGDTDHCQGLLDIAAYIPVRRIVSAPIRGQEPCVERLTRTRGTNWAPLDRGGRLEVGRWVISSLHPGLGSSAGANNRSLVLRANGFGRQILLTGDIERQAEQEILARFRHQLDSDVLKVAHHGSSTSSQAAFLAAVSPKLALVSAGLANRYGHPSPAVIDRLRLTGARTLRTDRDGSVRLRFGDDGLMKISTYGPH